MNCLRLRSTVCVRELARRARYIRARLATSAIAFSALAACADAVPQGSYGVNAIEIRGAEHMDEAAIAACLATHPRERFGFVVGGAPDPSCGQPPFNASRWPIELWTWPWTAWPLFNETAFERDRDRIERWYAARGYYDARVVNTQLRRDEEGRDRGAVQRA